MSAKRLSASNPIVQKQPFTCQSVDVEGFPRSSDSLSPRVMPILNYPILAMLNGNMDTPVRSIIWRLSYPPDSNSARSLGEILVVHHPDSCPPCRMHIKPLTDCFRHESPVNGRLESRLSLFDPKECPLAITKCAKEREMISFALVR